MIRRALLLALLLAAPAHASVTQESWFQDDNQLEFSEPAHVAKILDRLKAMGVDRVRVSVFWIAVAPQPGERRKPDGFDGADPDAYDQTRWERYDTLARLAGERGIGVVWNVTGPSPAWATKPLPSRPDIADAWYPNAREFGKFVRALGTRYSGTFIRPADRPQVVTDPGEPPTLLNPGRPPSQTTTEPGPPLPRVDHWEIWNEPNQGAWLAPQNLERTVNGRKRHLPASPRIYRRIADQTYAALVATGHGADTILVGSTAPKGSDDKGISRPMAPRQFIRELYCVDRNNQVYRGRAARLRKCPTKDQTTVFPRQHPVLFRATGWAHHPYEMTFAPSTLPPTRAYFTTANLGDLSRTLRYAWLRYGQDVPRGGVPLYLTEYGYQTDPPDPVGVSLGKQANFLAQAEYLTFRNRAVRAHSQFLLYDNGAPIEDTFQSGLLFENGRAKPAYQAYRLPLWLPDRRGRSIKVFGLARGAANGTPPQVEIQFRAPRAKEYRTLRTVTATADRGYVLERVRVPGTGRVRLASGGLLSRSLMVFR